MFRRTDVRQLIDESKKYPDVLTIEATVITGFESASMDECREKCHPLALTKAQGRIYFNIYSHEFDKVLQLRSVDNLFLVNYAFGSIDLKKNKEEDLELIKSLVHKVNWEESLSIWAKLLNFDGVLFPMNSISDDKFVNHANDTVDENNGIVNKFEANELHDVPQEDNYEQEQNDIPIDVKEETNANIINELSKLKIGSEVNCEFTRKEDQCKPNTNANVTEEPCHLMEPNEASNIINHLNESCFPEQKHSRKISESSNDTYFSAEEDDSILEVNTSPSRKEQGDQNQGKSNKPKPDNNILKFRATCNRVGDHSFSSMEAAACFGGALNDKFMWTVDLTNFDLNVILNINKDSAYICSAITGRSMHRRNITHFGYVTLRSTMCYNLVRLAEPMRGEVILDPLCGGGSIPIEGALGFPCTYHVGGDNNDKAMNRTLANVNHLKETQTVMVDAVKWSARKLPLKDSCIDVCVTDLPFGKRSGKKADNLPLYRDVLTEMARISRCGTARAVLLTHDKKAFTKAMYGANGEYWRQIRMMTVNQGGLFSTVFLLLRTAKPFFV